MDPEVGGVHDCVPFEPGANTTVSTELETRSWTVGFHPCGILVGEIDEQSPAELAGLRSGDIIVNANDEAIQDLPEFNEIRDSVLPGEELRLQILRREKTVALSVRRPC